MGRGFFSGVIWGALISVMGLWLLSEISDVVRVLGGPPENVQVEAPAAVERADEATEPAPASPGERPAPATDPSRQTTGLATGAAETAPSAETTPAATPSAGNGQAALAQPEAGGETAAAPDAAANGVAALPKPVAQPPQPTTETAPSAVAPPSAPAAEVGEAGSLGAAPEVSAGVRIVTPDGGDAPTESAGVNAPGTPQGETAPMVDFSNPQIVVPEPDTGSETVQPATAETPPAAPNGEEPAQVPGVAAPPAPATAEAGPAVEATTPPPAAPSADAAEDGGARSAAAVTVNRLPTIGGDQPAEAAPEAVEPAPQDGGVALDQPAIDAFAAAFDNPEGLPVMSILLTVEPGDTAAIPDLPFPVSYIVDASKPGAGAQMRRIRDAGHEVVALAPLPPKASPVDVEVAFQTYLSAVPEAVAVIDTRSAEFQSGRAVATQVAEALAASGHGLITHSRGLNAATQVAARAGVPAGLVFREFDADGQDRAAMKRFLDQAAFRAGQQEGVILVGHLRAETVAALTEWSLGTRAATLALAPVSVTLKAAR